MDGSTAYQLHQQPQQNPYGDYAAQYNHLIPSSSTAQQHPLLPGQQPQGAVSDADFELMKRSFASATLGGNDPSSFTSSNTAINGGSVSQQASQQNTLPGVQGKKSRYNSMPGHQFQQSHPPHKQQQNLAFGQLPPMGNFDSAAGLNASTSGPRNDSVPNGMSNSTNGGGLFPFGDHNTYAAMVAGPLNASTSGSNNALNANPFPSIGGFPAGYPGALAMTQQPSHTSPTSSSGHFGHPQNLYANGPSSSTSNGNTNNMHQRTVSAMAGLPGTPSLGPFSQTSPQLNTSSPQYGMVGPAGFASNLNLSPNAAMNATSPSSNPATSPFPNINNPPLSASMNAAFKSSSPQQPFQQQQQHQALLTAAAALAAATSPNNYLTNNLNSSITSPPMAQNMSAMSSLSGGLQSSTNSLGGAMSGGTAPLSPLTAFTTPGAFGTSPAFPSGPFNPALTAGLGVPGLFGLNGFNSLSSSVGGLGVSVPMGSPSLSQPLSDSGAASAGPQVIRTVYVGNLPGDASVDELLSQVRYGPIESVKILPDKSCAFISFLDPQTAAAFHSDANLRKLQLHNQDLKIGWGKPTSIPAAVLQAVQQFGATRNVYLGNLEESYTEADLRDDMSKFGHLDQVKIVRDKNIGFVHFLSISNAIKVVSELPKDPAWQGRRVNYGKDRCAYVPRNQHQQQQHNQMAAAMAAQAASQLTGYSSPFNYMSPVMPMSPMMSPLAFQGGFSDPALANGNRTVYLGNLHPDTTCEDVCNTIRGGILQEVRHIPDKHICFITFVLPESALALHQAATQQGITIRNRRLKVGWGKPSGPCPPGIAAIVNAGGSRNVYIGNIDDFEFFTIDKIKEDLGEHGEIEQVNALEEKSCAFVNFTKIASAVKAIEALKSHPDYSRFKIAYGKDRVGNLARGPFTRRGNHHGHASHHRQQNNGFSPSPGYLSPPPDGPGDDAALGHEHHEQESSQVQAVKSAAAAVNTVEQKQQDQVDNQA